MSRICGYRCEHNKSGICQISVCDKKSNISDKTEVQTFTRYIDPTITELQQENKKLNGAIQTYDILLKANVEENQELKEKLDKYENPEDMTLMMMWCTEKVKDENETLKKQLDDVNEKILLLQASEPMLNYKKALEETQQKEFIKYLENMLDDENDIFSVVRVKNVLQKYKEIIGVSDDNKTNV